ncbi:hypothetical protein MKS88_002880 [Plasmodium brasilianum]|uniref:Uncharacterized protein n=1 Tax=Plasmodium brasilianum TaxID=5824 RepID=A0ACB9YAS5_PLABR|nr:hypothetical protein MKS88_002880 [Plasmodium brasilianum]
MWNFINYNNDQGNDNAANNNFTLWNILGYAVRRKEKKEKKKDKQNEEEENNEDNNNAKSEKHSDKELVDETVAELVKEPVDETAWDTVNDSADDSEKEKKKEKEKEKEKKKEKEKEKEKKKEKEKEKEKKKEKERKKEIHLSAENRNISPFLSDLSSYADYYPSDEGTNKYNLNINSESLPSNEKREVAFSQGVEVGIEEREVEPEGVIVEDNVGVEKDVLEIDEFGDKNKAGESLEQPQTREKENSVFPLANEWFFDKIKEMLEPTMNQESIGELITNKYNSFNEANSGIFDLIENLLVRTSTQDKMDINKKQKNNYIYHHYNSMDCSNNDDYNFINYSIYCINKELATNVELEATKMMKIYNHAFNNFKKDINFKDDVYKDLVNDCEEFSTLIIVDEKDEKKKKKKEYQNLTSYF